MEEIVSLVCLTIHAESMSDGKNSMTSVFDNTFREYVRWKDWVDSVLLAGISVGCDIKRFVYIMHSMKTFLLNRFIPLSVTFLL